MVNLPDLVQINHDTFYSARCCFPGLAGPEQIGDNVPVNGGTGSVGQGFWVGPEVSAESPPVARPPF